MEWSGNCGYPGETSFVEASMFYGQYYSLYDARLFACNNTVCTQQCVDQLQVGVNDLTEAKVVRLDRVVWNQKTSQTSKDFLTWVRSHVAAGQPVIMGVFKNYNVFGISTDPNAGNSKYDQIVTVTSWQSQYPASDMTFHEEDVITIEDHGLYNPYDGMNPPYFFSFTVGDFLATRQQANSPDSGVYSVNSAVGYGIALLGPEDTSDELLPVRVDANISMEVPEIVDGSNTRPPAESVNLTITVSNVVPGVHYNLYFYDSFDSTPKMNYNQKAKLATSLTKFTIESGSTYTLYQTVQSDTQAIYRCVDASSP